MPGVARVRFVTATSMVSLRPGRRVWGRPIPSTQLTPVAFRDVEDWVGGLSAATRNCPETATKLPAGGHENCPLTVMGSARHDVVCLTASHG
jgi:hypothetical protein